MRRFVCLKCLAGEHGPDCQGSCSCSCRAVLGFAGPFGFDLTAPDPTDRCLKEDS
jgi:hypothetical protein